MSRVKLTEFKAKTLLVDDYTGVAVYLNSLEDDVLKLKPSIKYVLKVDQGVKKRGKLGLIKLNVTIDTIKESVLALAKKGYGRFLVEEMVKHSDDEESYISFERTRNGIQVHFSQFGGIDIEEHKSTIKKYSVENVPLPTHFIKRVVNTMEDEHLSFVEINPLIVRADNCVILDAAVLADSAGEYLATWSEEDVVRDRVNDKSEIKINIMNQTSPASLSFKLLNPDGAIWMLLSGGGASITIADEAFNKGKVHLVGNYGEYSGSPTQEETYLYSHEVIDRALRSSAPKKALVIAGGVANFTDIKDTFKGIIQALEDNIDKIKESHFKVFVRRGGPNEDEGLSIMRDYLVKNDILGSVRGSESVLTDIIIESIEYIDA